MIHRLVKIKNRYVLVVWCGEKGWRVLSAEDNILNAVGRFVCVCLCCCVVRIGLVFGSTDHKCVSFGHFRSESDVQCSHTACHSAQQT